MRDVVTAHGGPFVSDQPVKVAWGESEAWTLEMLFTVGDAKRTRLIAHNHAPGEATGWWFGLMNGHFFVEVATCGVRRHARGGRVVEGDSCMVLLHGFGDNVQKMTLNGVAHKVESEGAVLPDGLGPFDAFNGLQLGGLRDRAGGHADLRFGLDHGDDLYIARWWPSIRDEASITKPEGVIARRKADRPPAADLPSKQLFSAGEHGYAGFRIPGIMRLPSGTLIAVCEGRHESLSDSCPSKDLVLKRSSDGGRTWSDLKLAVEGKSIHDGNTGSAMNPCLLHDHVLGTNRTLLVFTALAGTEWEAEAGQTRGTLYIVESLDEGETWSAPRRLLHPDARPDDLAGFGEDFVDATPNLQAPSLGHGVQIESGNAAGWMMLCGNATFPSRSVFSSVLLTYVSDDAGRTWRFGPSVIQDEDGSPALGMNETSMALVGRDAVLLSVRSYLREAPTGQRALVMGRVSRGGVWGWSTVRRSTHLIAPAVHGSAVGCPTADAPERVVLSHPTHRFERRDLDVITMVGDGAIVGRRRIRSGFAAYTDLAYQPTSSEVIVAFESSLEGEISCARVAVPTRMDAQP